MELKAGSRVRSVTDSAEFMVIRVPGEPVDLRCGGHPMVSIEAVTSAGAPLEPGFDAGCQIGKRYVHDATGLELLCVKAGAGSLSIGVEPLTMKVSKPLPSSD